MKKRYFDLPVGLIDQRLGISPPNHHNTQYTYDKNGNLTKDLNKNISSIQYNFLNLPANITYSSGKSAAYIYDANGQKLRTSYKASASATAVPTDYCGNMIYENGVLKQVLVDGGYMTVTGTPFYFYYLKDHLGSNRVEVSPAGTATQINHYYPFGGLFGENTGNTGQRYKYNGKEFDRTHGLDWYDYGARHMSPDAGRFTTIDPMAEKYYNISPYAYCADNPINLIDKEGKKINIAKNRSQVLLWINSLTNGEFTINKKGDLAAPLSYNDVGSSYYTSMLLTAIKSPNTIYVFVDNEILANGEYKSLENYGEGATIPLNYEGDMKIVVSGKPYNGLKDCDGNKLVDTPNYILAHELVGHAIPMIIGGSNNEGGTLTKPINGNAIDNENKVRKEVGSPLRDNKRIDNIYDDSFYESISTYYDFMDMYNSMLWR